MPPARPLPTPCSDGQNYDPTNKWVLFGHHFAAISGAGPLIGPVLAAQYGFLPGLLWILIGVCLAGAVQDFVVLGLSMRRGGKSLAQIAYLEIGPVAGTAATVGILFVLVIALAGLGKVVVKALGNHVDYYPVGTHFVAPTPAPYLKRTATPTCSSIVSPTAPTLSTPPTDKIKTSVDMPIDQQIEIEAQPTDGREYAVPLDTYDDLDPAATSGIIPAKASSSSPA